MLRIKRSGGTVFFLEATLKRKGPKTISNGKPRRDSAGGIDSDKQWCRVQFVYDIYVDLQTRDNLWSLYKDSDPILTPSGATNQFWFYDDEILNGWVECTQSDIEHVGEEESYETQISLECSVSDYDSNRRTA